MDYNELACLGLVRQIVKSSLNKPSVIYKNYSIYEILGRLEFATSNNKLIEMYCDVIGLDSKKVRKKIVEKNLHFLYELKYKKVKNIKLSNIQKTKKWIIE